MPNRINTIFEQVRREGRTALMPFMTAGYPSLEATAKAIPAVERAGASIVELGIPFSDPIADGPVIAASMHEALQAGVTPAQIIEMVREVRSQTELGLVAMVSESIAQRMDPSKFIAQAAEVGFDGLIVPDTDLTSAMTLRSLAMAQNLTFSMLIAPTTLERRIERLTNLSSGFVYLLARVGLTGEQAEFPPIEPRVEVVRRYTDLPIAVGFGISTPAHVQAVTRCADAAIVGSALVRRMGEADDPVTAASSFVAELATGLSSRAAAS